MRGSNPLVASNNIDLDGEEELEEEKFYSHLNITVSSHPYYNITNLLVNYCAMVMCDIKHFIYCLSQILHTKYIMI